MEKHSIEAIVGALNMANVRCLGAREEPDGVFLVSPQHALTEIDLFVEPPLDVETAYRDAVRKEVAPGVAATFIGIQDLLDLEKLKSLDSVTRDE